MDHKLIRESAKGRRRKIRCDGQTPECRNCTKSREQCQYKDSSRVNIEESAKLREKESELRALQDRVLRLDDVSDVDRSNAVTELIDAVRNAQRPVSGSFQIQQNLTDSGQTNELSVDDTGAVRYYGATSRFHLSPYKDDNLVPETGESEFHRKWLQSNARFQKAWESKALERLRQEQDFNEISAADGAVLLDIYWTWQAPLHNCIYRRCKPAVAPPRGEVD